MNQQKFTEAVEGLTRRRQQVLLKMLAGETDKAIAQSLHIEEATVRKHIEKICLAFGIKNEFPDERRSKRSDLLALFSRYKPELISRQAELSELKVSQPAKQVNGNSVTLTSDSPFASIYNRDVFILIDQSGSMTQKDADTGDQTRYQYLQEVVQGHVGQILSVGQEQRGTLRQKICDEISIYFFSKNEVVTEPVFVRNSRQIPILFQENRPKTKTFISPYLEKCVKLWLAQGKPQNRGAFFIIYTDGLFDDVQKFVDCISSICAHTTDAKSAIFLVLGLGEDINVDYFLELDFNINQQMPFDVVAFDLVNEADDIIHVLERQLMNELPLAFPSWVWQRYPEFVKKAIAQTTTAESNAAC
jgi:DNA-binding CsgD family transcriptional regulator